jgi:integrase
VFERETGNLTVEVYERTSHGLKPKRVSLGHRDRERAKRQADQLAAKFAAGDRTAEADPMLGALFDNYLEERTPTKRPRTQKHDRRARELFVACFGHHRKVSTLSARDWHRYIELRRRGVLGGRAVGNRTIESDLKWLLAVLNWAVRAHILARNPLTGLPVPREKNPNRPVFTDEEYAALCRLAPTIDRRFLLAVVLAHETGHRIGAIRQLRWSDLDLEAKTVAWRAETDKTGRAHTTPLTRAAIHALHAERQRHPVIGDQPLFPSRRNPRRPLSGTLFHQWMWAALDVLGLRKRRGLGFHGLRRKFATELRNVPLKDLMTLGGWRDHRTILQCYQHLDLDAMRSALESRRESTHQSTHRADAVGEG